MHFADQSQVVYAGFPHLIAAKAYCPQQTILFTQQVQPPRSQLRSSYFNLPANAAVLPTAPAPGI